MLKVTGIIAAIVVSAVAGVAYYAGMFDPVEISREECGPFSLVYREYRGPYRASRFVINNVYRYAHDTLHLRPDTAFAVFYDDPQSNRPDTLRSIGGIVSAPPSTLPSPYQTATFGRTNAVIGRFRRRSSFSYSTGSYKFYSELARLESAEHKGRHGPVLELYLTARRTICFIMPVGSDSSPAPVYRGRQ